MQLLIWHRVCDGRVTYHCFARPRRRRGGAAEAGHEDQLVRWERAWGSRQIAPRPASWQNAANTQSDW